MGPISGLTSWVLPRGVALFLPLLRFWFRDARLTLPYRSACARQPVLLASIYCACAMITVSTTLRRIATSQLPRGFPASTPSTRPAIRPFSKMAEKPAPRRRMSTPIDLPSIQETQLMCSMLTSQTIPPSCQWTPAEPDAIMPSNRPDEPSSQCLRPPREVPKRDLRVRQSVSTPCTPPRQCPNSPALPASSPPKKSSEQPRPSTSQSTRPHRTARGWATPSRSCSRTSRARSAGRTRTRPSSACSCPR